MKQELWDAVDRYFSEQRIREDPVLEAVLAESAKAGLPHHDLAPNQAKLQSLLARIQGAKKILEIGTLGCYSAIWLARALPPDGHPITLEIDPIHADVARRNLARAGLAAEPRLTATAIQTVGSKGYDGFALALVTG